MTPDVGASYADLHDRLTAFFGRRLPPAERHLAEDLAQDVFVRALRTPPRYVPPGGLDRWLWMIARNLLIDHRKSAQRRVVVATLDAFEAPDLDGWLAVADPDLEAVTDRLALDGAIARLTPEQREVVTLYYEQGCPYYYLQRPTGLTADTAKKRKHRAFKQLRRMLSEVA